MHSIFILYLNDKKMKSSISKKKRKWKNEELMPHPASIKKIQNINQTATTLLTVGLNERERETSRPKKSLLSILEANDDVTSTHWLPLSSTSFHLLCCFRSLHSSSVLGLLLSYLSPYCPHWYTVSLRVYVHFSVVHSLDRWDFCRFTRLIAWFIGSFCLIVRGNGCGFWTCDAWAGAASIFSIPTVALFL